MQAAHDFFVCAGVVGCWGESTCKGRALCALRGEETAVQACNGNAALRCVFTVFDTDIYKQYVEIEPPDCSAVPTDATPDSRDALCVRPHIPLVSFISASLGGLRVS